MRLFLRRWLFAASVLFVSGAACGSSAGSDATDGGASGAEFLTWTPSTNGKVVLDANGNSFEFQSSTGCMYSVQTMIGPDGFCLAASASSGTGYASYGATNCVNPSTNSDCNTATFDVIGTDNPSGTGCIAVLANGGASALTGVALGVTTAANVVSLIQTTKSPGAYKVYWNGIVPACGGTNPYAGSYTSTTTAEKPYGWVSDEGGCVLSSANQEESPFLTVTVDSVGTIDNDTLQITGTLASDGTGSFVYPTQASSTNADCIPTFTITGVTGSKGHWVIAGTEAFGNQTIPFSLTEQ